MGRINLAALRVRTRSLQRRAALNYPQPAWADVVADIPPAQILTRQQPRPQAYTETRMKSLPKGPSQVTQEIKPRTPKNAKAKNLYSPKPIRYEEDALRKRFFADHPWELARPRTLVETTGNQHVHADWSTGIKQRGIPVSGESVVQRQLWLLHNVPDITVPEAYDIARKEFYVIRRRQQTGMRIAVEEAEMFGADFGRPVQSVGMSKEDVVYNQWLEWAAEENVKMMQSRAGFEGQQLSIEQKTMEENVEAPSALGMRYGGSREGFKDRTVTAPSARVKAPLI